MRKIGYCIFISLIPLLHLQSLIPSAGLHTFSYYSLEFSRYSNSLLPGSTEISETTLTSNTEDDFILLAAIEPDNNLSFSLRKSEFMGREGGSKHAQGDFRQPYLNAPGKPQFPYLYDLSSPRLISFGILRTWFSILNSSHIPNLLMSYYWFLSIWKKQF